MTGHASSSADGGRPTQPGELSGHIHCPGEGSGPGFRSSVQDSDVEAMQVASLLQSALTASREVLAKRYSTAENTRNIFTFLEFHKPATLF